MKYLVAASRNLAQTSLPSNKISSPAPSWNTEEIDTHQRKSGRRLSSLPLAIAAVLGSLTPAQAFTFNFTYQPGFTQQQIEAVELAGNIWSSYLTDNVSVNLHLEMTNGMLPTNTLGGATPAIVKMNYDKFKEGLQLDGTANVNLLPTSNQSSNYFAKRLQNGSIDHSGYELMQTTANNKALGNDLSGGASGLDGYIQLDQSANWNYDYADGNIGNNQYDFVSVVLHELGHNLGFISGLDPVGEESSRPTALDMFRYSSQSQSQGAMDYAIGGAKYFSIDGGQTAFSANGQVAQFATGENSNLGGDGNQASHWKYNANNPLGIMDPKLLKGQIREVSMLDLTAMDYIGWNVNHSANLNLSNLLSQAQSQAANASIQDRSDDVEDMMEISGIYNLGPGGWWQGRETSTDVPEPVSTIGLLGLGLWGVGSWFQRRKESRQLLRRH